MKIIFLTGHRKSGTTLLHKLFDSHPTLNIYPVDIALLYAFLPCKITNQKEDDLKRIELVIRKSLQQIEGRVIPNSNTLFSISGFLDCLLSDLNDTSLNESPDLVTTLATTWVSYNQLDPNLPMVVKETSQSIHAPYFSDHDTDFHFVQIVRDPRDNYAAIKAGSQAYYSKMGEGENESLASLINRARMDLEVAKSFKENATPRFSTLKFEDLVSDTESIMRDLCVSLGITFSKTMLEPTFLGDQFQGNSHEKKLFQGVSSQNTGRWPNRISQYEAGVIEYWMHEVMRYWGYETAISPDLAMAAFADFYNWYNCKYFYYDSFAKEF